MNAIMLEEQGSSKVWVRGCVIDRQNIWGRGCHVIGKHHWAKIWGRGCVSEAKTSNWENGDANTGLTNALSELEANAVTEKFATSLQMCAKTSSPHLQSWQKAWGLPSKNWPGSPLLNFTQQNPSSPATGPLPLPLPQWGTLPLLLKQAQKERKRDYLRCYLMSCMIKPT